MLGAPLAEEVTRRKQRAELQGPRRGWELCLDAAQHQDSESGRPLYSWPAAESAHGPRHAEPHAALIPTLLLLCWPPQGCSPP